MTTPVFPRQYITALCDGHETCPGEDEMFQNVGIAAGLALLLNEAAFLSAQPSIIPAAIKDFERRLEIWQPPLPPQGLSPKEAMDANDYFHSCSAWKAGLQIYTSRVFRDTKASDPQMQFLVRQCLVNISSIMAKGVHKQLIWSLFIAASEIVVEEMKPFVRRIVAQIETDVRCLFVRDVAELLERLWKMRKEWDGEGGEVWWGDVLKVQQGHNYLFG